MKNHKKLVRKSNDIVAVKNNLSVAEVKILTLILEQIKTTDTEFTVYSLSVKGYENSTNTIDAYKLMKKVIKRLMSRVFELPNEKLVNLFHSAQYIAGQGIIQIELHKDMKPYFLELKRNYTQYESRFLLCLKSKYSIRFYEYFKKELGLKKSKKISIFLDIEQLREKLMVKNKFKQIGELKKRALNSSKEEINKNTDIEFDYLDIKNGRKIIAFQFIVKVKESKPVEEPVEVIEDVEIVDTKTARSEIIEKENIKMGNSYIEDIKNDLKNMGFKEKDIEEILKKYDEDYIIGNIKELKERALNGVINTTIPRYTKGFSIDFRPPTNTFLEQQKEQKRIEQKLKEKQRIEQRKKEEKEEADNQRLREIRKEFFLKTVAKITDEQKQDLLNITKKIFMFKHIQSFEELKKKLSVWQPHEVNEYLKITNKKIIKFAKTKKINLVETEDKNLKIV